MDKKIKVLRSDQDREYLFNEFENLYDEKGIKRQLSISYTSQQNGFAERRNITLLKMVTSMMAQTNLPITFWDDALLTTSYILN